MIVEPFLNFLEGLSVVPSGNLIGKIFNLSQSSGFGKTRLCIEILRAKGRGIYCVHRMNNGGYPKTTPWMSKLFSAFDKSTSDAQSMRICYDFVKKSLERFNDYGKRVEDMIDAFVGSKPECADELSFDLTSDIDKQTLIDSIKALLTPDSTTDSGHVPSPARNSMFPFFFDECQEFMFTPNASTKLSSLLTIMTRVFVSLKELPIVCCFLGTKSSLANFVLNAPMDPSVRKRYDSTENAFRVPSYILTATVDAEFRDPISLSYGSLSILSAACGDFVRIPGELKKLAMMCGRPLWFNYAQIFQDAFDAAKYKLSCNTENLTELTCMIMRTGSSVQPQDTLAHKLVLSGMATLLYVDIDTSRCWIDFIPEPMVSNGARSIMTNFRSLSKGIAEYVRLLELGTFHGSRDAGELVARIILLRNMDLCLVKRQRSDDVNNADLVYFTHDEFFGVETTDTSKLNFLAELDKIANCPAENRENRTDLLSTSFFIPKVAVSTVKEFLLMLSKCPVGQFDNFGVSESVLEGLVSVTQFIQMDGPISDITAPFLVHCFARSCAMILPPRAPGLDLLIPVLRSDNKMSVIAIQVKNLSTTVFPSYLVEVNSELKANFLNYFKFSDSSMKADDFIRVIIQFSDDSSTASTFVWYNIPGTKAHVDSSETTGALWLRGLRCFNSLFFDNELILKNLEIILSGNRDFLKATELPEVQLPTLLQTSREGLRFLANQARHLSRPENVLINDRNVRSEVHYKKYLKKLSELQLPMCANEHRINSAIILGNAATPGPISISAQDRQVSTEECAQIHSDVLALNRSYDTKYAHKNAINNFLTVMSQKINGLVDRQWNSINGLPNDSIGSEQIVSKSTGVSEFSEPESSVSESSKPETSEPEPISKRRRIRGG